VTGWHVIRFAASSRELEETSSADSRIGQRGLAGYRIASRRAYDIAIHMLRLASTWRAVLRSRSKRRKDRLRNPDLAGLDGEIADWSIGRHRAARCLADIVSHRTASGLSRDLIIRGLADTPATARSWRPEPRSTAPPTDFGGRLRERCSASTPASAETGTTLVRPWRGHTHTVLVREGGFEYNGQRYRSLTVIPRADYRAHWSGPRSLASTASACILVTESQ